MQFTENPEDLIITKELPYLVVGQPDQIEKIVAINLKIFPVRYPNDFYQKLVTEKNIRTYLLWNDKDKEYIGILSIRLALPCFDRIFNPNDGRCREPCMSCQKRSDIEARDSLDRFAYVILLGLVPEQQGKGLGKILVDKTEEICRENGIDHIVLHVQTCNNQAIMFYYKLGFKLVKYVKDYYYNVSPKDAFLLRKCLYSS
ncbi:N-alpha-acetyltransferase 50 [Nematocida homosporus]|uniref:N-alpha-acetyltransferase 50 n=1 Tax=Nematocida homosporus TaxID=1912981 RepID=UPI00221F2D3E|nr:N-alpha-acetyltransferase 50 [Nematocida homosporus]KAI5187732.1 N-alpha-acetyltransferase 50 [Nematocida homosporus]